MQFCSETNSYTAASTATLVASSLKKKLHVCVKEMLLVCLTILKKLKYTQIYNKVIKMLNANCMHDSIYNSGM